MLIGPIPLFYFQKNKQAKLAKLAKLDKLDKPVNETTDTTNATETLLGVGLFLVVTYLFFVTMWIWNIVLIALYWERMRPVSRILAIIGILSGVFAPISVLLTYLTLRPEGVWIYK